MPRYTVTVESPYDYEDDRVTFTVDTAFSRLVKRTATAAEVLKAVCEERNPTGGTVTVTDERGRKPPVVQRRKPSHPRRPYYARKPGAPIPRRRRRRPRKPR